VPYPTATRLESNSVKIGGVFLALAISKNLVTKKRKITMQAKYFTHLPRRPHWGDHFEFWLV